MARIWNSHWDQVSWTFRGFTQTFDGNTGIVMTTSFHVFTKKFAVRVIFLKKNWNCAYVCLYVCALIDWERIHRFALNLSLLFLEARKRYRKAKTPENVSWLRVPLRAVPAARKLFSSPDEDGCCSSETKHKRRTAPRPTLFLRGDYRNKGHSLEKSDLDTSPVKMVSLTRKLSSLEAGNPTPSIAK
jgi:hypothetical protein